MDYMIPIATLIALIVFHLNPQPYWRILGREWRICIGGIANNFPANEVDTVGAVGGWLVVRIEPFKNLESGLKLSGDLFDREGSFIHSLLIDLDSAIGSGFLNGDVPNNFIGTDRLDNHFHSSGFEVLDETRDGREGLQTLYGVHIEDEQSI